LKELKNRGDILLSSLVFKFKESMNKIEDLLNLSEEILENIEKSNISFQEICLKVSRLSRLL